ncbi:MAG TPA: flavodoxin family protein [Candidatus Hydrogenedentes bacterium]|nr:flavodoxin family protein [Candidatus Hydrogenedentota bacterium]
MNLLIISGSRNPEGQTARAANAIAEGASAGGWGTETVFLPASRIERCRQCDDDGWGLCREGVHCVIEDGFAALVDKVRQADVVVFANPVYFSDLSESLRAFLDRLRRICVHGARIDRIEGKPAVGVCVAGGGGGGAPKCAAHLEQILATCGFDVVDMVPVRRQNLEMKLDVLRAVGRWLASKPTSV